MAYCDPAEMILRKDARDIGQLVSDENVDVSPEDLATNPVLLQALEDASGDVDTALLTGGRYTPDQLASLAGNSLAKLQRIVAELAMYYLIARRPTSDPERFEMLNKIRESHLEPLRKGENVFNLTPQIEAGQPSADGPSTLDLQNLNLVRDRVLHYYPRRYLPGNR